jgi:hypothetical protein
MGCDGGNVVSMNGRVVRQPGDGSCLFHSLCYGLGDGTCAAQVHFSTLKKISKKKKKK